ncbi:MAG: hypothetical protein K0U20_08470 [Proteobacteria bacterium]|nr:hypothetical protein [Pseudomonadota bacterium]
MLSKLKQLQQVTVQQNDLLRLRLKEIRGQKLTEEEYVKMHQLRTRCEDAQDTSWECQVLDARLVPFPGKVDMDRSQSFVPGVGGVFEEVEDVEGVEVPDQLDRGEVSEDYGRLQDKFDEAANERDQCQDELKAKKESCDAQITRLREDLDKGVDLVMREKIDNLELQLFQKGAAPVWDEQDAPGAFEKSQNIITELTDKRTILVDANTELFPQVADLEARGLNDQARLVKQQLARNDKQIDELNERIDLWDSRKKKTVGYKKMVAEWDQTFVENEGPINEAALALMRSYIQPVGVPVEDPLRGQNLEIKLNQFLDNHGVPGLKVLDLDNVWIPKPDQPKVFKPKAPSGPPAGMGDLLKAIQARRLEGGAIPPPPLPPPLPSMPIPPPPPPLPQQHQDTSTPSGRLSVFQDILRTTPDLVAKAQTEIEKRLERLPILFALRRLPEWGRSIVDIRNALIGASNLDSVEARALSIVLPRNTPSGTPSKSDKDALLQQAWTHMESKMPSMLKPQAPFVRDKVYLNAALPPVGAYAFEAVEIKIVKVIKTISKQDCDDYVNLKDRPNLLESHVFSDSRNINELEEVLAEDETIEQFCLERYGVEEEEEEKVDAVDTTQTNETQPRQSQSSETYRRSQPASFEKPQRPGRSSRSRTKPQPKPQPQESNPLLAAIQAAAKKRQERQNNLAGGFIQVLNGLN